MKRILSFFLALLLLCPAILPHALDLPDVSAQSAILIDASDGFVLFEKDADTRLSMASTTKIMTALCALEVCELSDVVSVPDEAVGVEGSSAYLYENEPILVRDLIYALLLQSANDAAVALAIHACGSVDAFVDRMNEKADALGMHSSRFANPHGLNDADHYSTARDLALLMQSALQNPFFAAVIGTRTYTTSCPDAEKSQVHYFRNHNRLLASYPDCIGGKTGFTQAAGRCLVSAARRGGATLICVTLNAPDDWNDHTTLYDSGFARYTEQTLLEKNAIELALPVVGGTQKTVTVTNHDELRRLVRDFSQITIRYELAHFVYAPVTGLDQIQSGLPAYSLPMRAGRALIYQNGALIAQTDLYYRSTVEEEIPPTFWERILQFFGWNKSGSRNS